MKQKSILFPQSFEKVKHKFNMDLLHMAKYFEALVFIIVRIMA